MYSSRALLLAIAAVAVIGLSGIFLTQVVSGKPTDKTPEALNTSETSEHTNAILLGTCFEQCAKKTLIGGLVSYGPGYIIGTGPICKTDCTVDCFGRHCFAADPLSADYGSTCYNSPLTGKICCCAEATGSISRTEPVEPRKGSTSCAQFCSAGGYGYGIIVGTAPACDASCADDTSGGLLCSTANDYFSDYGSGCLSGSKVCVCAANKPGAEVPGPAPPSSFSCDEMCRSGGWARGEMSGTAPFCSGDCQDDSAACFVASSELSDYGSGCATGSKRCSCFA